VLVELRVRNLGVFEDASITFAPGMTALTGETGAGKTLIVDAIALLAGGPTDPVVVRPGAAEALVEGRFVLPGRPGTDADEVVVSRAVPIAGRSRSYVDTKMVSASTLSDVVRSLVEINGQHGFAYLLSAQVQRDLFDEACSVDTARQRELRREVTRLRSTLEGLGADPVAREREMDLLGYQLQEIDSARIDDPDEELSLRAEQESLADVAGTVDAARSLREALVGDGGSAERVGDALALAGSRPALASIAARLAGVSEEIADCAAEARLLAENLEANPQRLDALGERLGLLAALRRKYGPTLAEVVAYRERIRSQLEELHTRDGLISSHREHLEALERDLRTQDQLVLEARREAAPVFSSLVESQLPALALQRARFGVDVASGAGKQAVTWLFAANPGQAMLPLSKVASGGELARVLLATRLAIARASGDGSAELSGPQTLIFDEVDAGVGGHAAASVGEALAELAAGRQVLVVTHLAQVAAFGDHQVVVAKQIVAEGAGDLTKASALLLDEEDRVVELARMLSGQPESAAARTHARELLDASRREPSGWGATRS
jgi:DNA repair protein RecN (Recombination protein N)